MGRGVLGVNLLNSRLGCQPHTHGSWLISSGDLAESGTWGLQLDGIQADIYLVCSCEDQP